ncbi:MAG: hypothetical protein LBM99_00540 [Bacillales bacterium]|jgi:hypothetical protein|nr:hypothetical protein [Bacillales bacterium]
MATESFGRTLVIDRNSINSLLEVLNSPDKLDLSHIPTAPRATKEETHELLEFYRKKFK